MTSLASRTFLSSLVTLAIVGTTIFFVLRILPGDIALQILGDSAPTQQQLATLRHDLGTDRPLPAQYGAWVGRLLRLDPGRSLADQRPIMGEFKRRFPLTLELALLSSLLGAVIGVPLGILTTVRQYHIEGYIAQIVGILGIAMPVFWTGTLVLLLLLKAAHWTPPVGYTSFRSNPLTHVQQMVLPVLVLAAGSGAILSRLVAGSVAEVLGREYVRTARAKGLTARAVLWRHVLRNALLPVVTVFGYQFAFLLGGAVVTEQLFGLPGLGTWFVQSIAKRDYPVVQFLVMFYVAAAIAVNLLVDLSYGIIDPRTR